MTTWQETLDSLSVRERSGKTAQTLIGAAEEMREQHSEALRLMALDHEEKIAKMGDRIESAEAVAASHEESVNHLRSALEEAHLEIERLKNPQVRRRVSDDVIEYTYSPAVTGSGNVSPWRLDELESVLMNVRINGGGEDTMLRVEVDQITVKIKDDGQPVSGWTRPGEEPEFSEEDLRGIRHARRRLWLIAGGIGFAIGSVLGVGVS